MLKSLKQAQLMELLSLSAPLLAAEKTTWSNMPGSATGLALAELMQARKGPVLCITPDMPSAMRLESELHFYGSNSTADAKVLMFPDREILPYDLFSPHQDLVSDRLRVLYHLPRMRSGLVIIPVQTLMHRLAPVNYVQSHSLLLEVGAQLDSTFFSDHLQNSGYLRVKQVMEHGEYSIRGSILDIFPMGSRQPYRIDLFDDEVESIRSFDPDSQKSTEVIPRVDLLPAREFPLTKTSMDLFYQGFTAHFDQNPHRINLFRELSEKSAIPAGIEFYLPLFFEQTATIFDYLPPSTLVTSLEDIETSGAEFWKTVKDRYERRKINKESPPLPPAELFIQMPEVNANLGKFPYIRLLENSSVKGQQSLSCQKLPDVELQKDSRHSLDKLGLFLKKFQGRVLLVAESAGRREVILDLIRTVELNPQPVESWQEFVSGSAKLAICDAPIDRGLVLKDHGLAVIPESMLYGERVAQRRRRTRGNLNPDAVIRNLQELKAGDPIVHVDYGVGRYQGLESLTLDGNEGEYLGLRYAGDDKILVPIGNLHLVHRYTGGSADQAPLHKLGSRQWEKARKRAREKAHDTAVELLEINARRAAATGFAHEIDEVEYHNFCNEFPFEETEDQATAIDAVLQDMKDAKPMNRMVCGDVGFGKTEVAMRAAFIAARSGQQVALLAPTTLLVQQHGENFRNRFANFAISVASLSRFQSKKEQEEVIAALALGTIDIVIGTHRLLQKDIKFRDLGLLILDEEQRFGVRHKEQMKKMRAEIDILTLTATPIPRTLNMTLAGLSDLSIIATPPARRLAIKTFVRSWDQQLIREACLREFNRGGQVYFLHNKVETIERMARDLEQLVPEANIGIAHGQMPERQLERVMMDFYHQRFNLLVCSTIIESGIDVPTANTIIINRADRLGLAQLHQLRGRVGRSHHQAYAYMMVPSKSELTGDALKRLEAIDSLGELGIGFILATQDMEIRGAGEILGESQSGEMHEIGFTLYSELLGKAVTQLKDGALDEDTETVMVPDIDLGEPAFIPEDYLPDVNTRLVLYKRISAASSDEDFEELQSELTDRFGNLPPFTNNLLKVSRLKRHAITLGVSSIRGGDTGINLKFRDNADINVDQLLRLLQSEPHHYRFNGQDSLTINKETEGLSQRIAILNQLFDQLAASTLTA